jgi:hypothetical protein
MRAGDSISIPGGTPLAALEAARQGGWIAARLARAAGLDGDATRGQVIARFLKRLDRRDEHQFETLMAEVQRGIEAALAAAAPRDPAREVPR